MSIAFGAFVIYLVGEADSDNEIRWTRLAWLFASVQAIAFGAAGALFGASVQRQRAENAAAAAGKNADVAARGRALAVNLQVDEPPSGVEGEYRAFGAGESPDAASIARRHAALARELFLETSRRTSSAKTS